MTETEQLTMQEKVFDRQSTDEVNVLRRHMKKRDPREALFAKHRAWMSEQEREFPMPYVPYRIGVYVRYYNQTKHEDYLEYHKQQYRDDIALCPRWTLVDFFVDSGAKAPKMENAPEWCRLLTDCFNGKINLIVTQNISFVSRDETELTQISRLLAAHGVGIYFISEDIFTTASYFRGDMFDGLNWKALPPDEFDGEPLISTPKIAGGKRGSP